MVAYNRPKSAAAKRRDADLHQQLLGALAIAHHFTCTIFTNGGYSTRRWPTLAEARADQPKLEAEVANGRKALVYVVTTLSHTILVPDSYQPEEASQ